MKKLVAITFVLFVATIYFYNTNWFQASFFDKRFYANIVDTPFDIIKHGENTTIPLKFKYKTCYMLGIKVPGRELSDSGPTGNGRLKYKFVSKGVVVADGITQPVPRIGWGGDDLVSIRKLMVFDLPFSDSSDDLNIVLEVIEPFTFMKEYQGQTSIVINPNYNPKLGECYDDEFRIEH